MKLFLLKNTDMKIRLFAHFLHQNRLKFNEIFIMRDLLREKKGERERGGGEDEIDYYKNSDPTFCPSPFLHPYPFPFPFALQFPYPRYY